jgi:hypothetical protein
MIFSEKPDFTPKIIGLKITRELNKKKVFKEIKIPLPFKNTSDLNLNIR